MGTGVIVAGGRSTRFGAGDKAVADLAGYGSEFTERGVHSRVSQGFPVGLAASGEVGDSKPPKTSGTDRSTWGGFGARTVPPSPRIVSRRIQLAGAMFFQLARFGSR